MAVPGSLLAGLVPLAVLAVILVSLAVRTHRGDFGEAPGGRRRTPCLVPVVCGIAAYAVAWLVTR